MKGMSKRKGVKTHLQQLWQFIVDDDRIEGSSIDSVPFRFGLVGLGLAPGQGDDRLLVQGFGTFKVNDVCVVCCVCHDGKVGGGRKADENSER